MLADLVATSEWNEYNYLNSASQDPRYRRNDPALRTLAEALGWLRARGFIARTPGQSADAAIFVTRAGHGVLKAGLARARAEARLQEGLHPSIEQRCRRQFLLGEYEQAVFVAMKAVEVRVRELAKLGEDATGVDLMNRAFGPTGRLRIPAPSRASRKVFVCSSLARTQRCATLPGIVRSTTTMSPKRRRLSLLRAS